MSERVLDGEFEGLAAHVIAGRRDVFFDEGTRGSFADDACGLTRGVAIDVAAEGIGCGGVDASGFECGGVGHSDVAVDAFEECRVSARDGVEILSRGQSFCGPLGVVPAAAEDPCMRIVESLRVGGDARLHLGERRDAVEVGCKALQAGVGDVRVGVVEAGHREGAVEVDLLRFGRGALQDFVAGAGEYDAVTGDADGLHSLRCGVVLDRVQADAGEDVAVVVDGVAALGVCGGGEYAEDAEQSCGLHVDESRIVPQFEVRRQSFREADFSGPELESHDASRFCPRSRAHVRRCYSTLGLVDGP